MILSYFKLQSLCTLSITKFCQNFILIFPKWKIPISIALDLQQALITTKLNVELKELKPLLDQGFIPRDQGFITKALLDQGTKGLYQAFIGPRVQQITIGVRFSVL